LHSNHGLVLADAVVIGFNATVLWSGLIVLCLAVRATECVGPYMQSSASKTDANCILSVPPAG